MGVGEGEGDRDDGQRVGATIVGRENHHVIGLFRMKRLGGKTNTPTNIKTT